MMVAGLNKRPEQKNVMRDELKNIFKSVYLFSQKTKVKLALAVAGPLVAKAMPPDDGPVSYCLGLKNVFDLAFTTISPEEKSEQLIWDEVKKNPSLLNNVKHILYFEFPEIKFGKEFTDVLDKYYKCGLAGSVPERLQSELEVFTQN
jgi:hypothetical protein